ncbi:hypothetical protein K438DRAFT_275936 [Mycena galopus ATCC 62051]|nr:hypothetical protein K438DRAFT_275936 [Mycena galopus ATCC 62051]
MDGLFSRATRVYRVILREDLMREDQMNSEPPRIYALKDAWGQACRRPEVDFYDAIAAHCKNRNVNMNEGMAQCKGSLDLSVRAIDISAEGTHPEDLPLYSDINLHITHSADAGGLERHHTRTLLTPVGSPLNSFESTKSLAEALCTAVHRTSCRLFFLSVTSDSARIQTIKLHAKPACCIGTSARAMPFSAKYRTRTGIARVFSLTGTTQSSPKRVWTFSMLHSRLDGTTTICIKVSTKV